eukprot:CAMPEP_0194276216 /NCGR_PEP_ID=MMETSP0169-20130528/8862_1 /TAXON_ID=218684 /ORGANISM="Corethron pennatum, Strain L29A3" /LENGTH=604 /DNA_ID=CAMNT_0039019881 /DNA_START=16 /DNA_END=1830 /DNA_ORIENTATION=-
MMFPSYLYADTPSGVAATSLLKRFRNRRRRAANVGPDGKNSDGSGSDGTDLGEDASLLRSLEEIIRGDASSTHVHATVRRVTVLMIAGDLAIPSAVSFLSAAAPGPSYAAGASPDSGNTVYHYVACNGSVECWRALEDGAALPSGESGWTAVNDFGDSPIMMACANDGGSIVKYAVETLSRHDGMGEAGTGAAAAVTLQYLACEMRNTAGMNALGVAAGGSRVGIIRMLLFGVGAGKEHFDICSARLHCCPSESDVDVWRSCIDKAKEKRNGGNDEDDGGGRLEKLCECVELMEFALEIQRSQTESFKKAEWKRREQEAEIAAAELLAMVEGVSTKGGTVLGKKKKKKKKKKSATEKDIDNGEEIDAHQKNNSNEGHNTSAPSVENARHLIDPDREASAPLAPTSCISEKIDGPAKSDLPPPEAPRPKKGAPTRPSQSSPRTPARTKEMSAHVSGAGPVPAPTRDAAHERDCGADPPTDSAVPHRSGVPTKAFGAGGTGFPPGPHAAAPQPSPPPQHPVTYASLNSSFLSKITSFCDHPGDPRALAADVSMLLRTRHGMALLSPSQLDVLQAVLEGQAEECAEARRIQRRVRRTLGSVDEEKQV